MLSRAAFVTAALAPLAALVVAVPAAADPPPPQVQLTNADDGQTRSVPAGTEVRVQLAPPRDGDVWHAGASGLGVDLRGLNESTSSAVLDVRVNADTTISAITDAACAHATSPCAYQPQHWSVPFTVPFA